MDSKPEALGKLDSRIIQLKMQRESLKNEEDEGAKSQRKLLDTQIEELEKQYADLNEIWQAEKALVKGSQQQEALDKARIDYDKASREGDYETMSKLQYETIPQLEKRLKQSDIAESKEHKDEHGIKLLRNKVTDNEIAEVVSPSLLGIPVNKMLQGERGKNAINGRKTTRASHWAR